MTDSKIHTPGQPNVSFPVPAGGECPGYLSPHGKGSTQGVIVLQEWWGMNASIQSTADAFAQQGFQALTPDLYRGKVAKDNEQAGHLMSNLDWPKAVGDIQGAAQFLLKNGCKKVGVVGFCMGGALAIASSPLPEISATAPYYGVPDLSTLAVDKIHGPVQGHFGANDTMKGFSDPEAARKLESTLKSAGKSVEIFIHEGVGHAFTNRDRPQVYNAEVTQKAWNHTFEFFKKNLQ